MTENRQCHSEMPEDLFKYTEWERLLRTCQECLVGPFGSQISLNIITAGANTFNNLNRIPRQIKGDYELGLKNE